jgi:cytochrome bd-type quinol oxidase subunit 2
VDVLGYNYPQIASAYSTFAGVLAGFVFAVIGYLLGSCGTQGRATRKYESALSWAILAFIGLSVSCFLYGVISGEDRFVAGTTLPSIRPFYLSMFASGVFTSSLVILLVGLIWLFHGDEATLSVMTQLRIAVYFTSLTALLFLSGLFSANCDVKPPGLRDGDETSPTDVSSNLQPVKKNAIERIPR